MPQRITEGMLEKKVIDLNKLTGHGNSKYGDVGRYTLDYADGGIALHQHLKTGGEKDIFSGHETKKVLFYKIIAYMNGIDTSGEKRIVWTHYHERTDTFIVFISGYSLDARSCTESIANKIARDVGQDFYTHTCYPATTGRPTITEESVY